MPLVTVVSHTTPDGTVALSYDVDNRGQVTGVQVNNGLPRDAAVEVTRPSGNVLTRSVPPGVTAVNVPRGLQFPYADAATASDWRVTVTA